MCADMGSPEIRWGRETGRNLRNEVLVGAWYVALADHNAISAW